MRITKAYEWWEHSWAPQTRQVVVKKLPACGGDR